MRLTVIILALCIAGCASRHFTVVLFRNDSASNIEERYAVDQDAVGTKTVKTPVDSESTAKKYTIDKLLVTKIDGLLYDSTKSLLAIDRKDKGEMISGIAIDEKNTHREITWSNVDPPVLTPAFDSLYHLMLLVEQQMVSP